MTNIDKASILRDAWTRARRAAAAASEGVRLHIGAAMRAAWSAAKAAAMVQQPAQLQQADASQGAAAATPAAPDLSTVEGLRAALVGRTAQLEVAGGEVTYRIVGIDRWQSPDGEQVRDYIQVEDEGMLRDDRKGPKGIHVVRAGTSRGMRVDTAIGEVRYVEGAFCNSNAKKGNARRLVQALLDIETPEA